MNRRRRPPSARPLEALEPRLLFAATALPLPAVAASSITPSFHLTARNWRTLNVAANDYLGKAEQLARALAAHQDDAGHIMDPYTGENEKSSTPYFAYVVGVLSSAGRADDLVPAGVRAMEAATAETAVTSGADDDDGNTFLQPLSDALAFYERHVTDETLASWRERLQRPIGDLIDSNLNNHRAYAMKGEWARALAGLVTRDDAIAFIEQNWSGSQRDRIAGDSLGLYHDRSSDPDSMATESVGRMQLLWILANGYDGPSRAEMESLLLAGTKNLLALQDPTGQAPTGGRASGAVWNDTNVALCFELAGKLSAESGDTDTAGAYRRAADLALQSVERFEQPDGSQTVLKNQYDPSLRVGFARYNSWSNSNASQAYRFATIYQLRRGATTRPPEAPTPAEIGGYALNTDSAFATAFADAGGLQLETSLRGSTEQTHGRYWSTLGITRISRPGWDSRLGPGDGQRDSGTGRAVSFAPEFKKSSGGWDRLSELPETYTATSNVTSVTPVLIRATIDYAPKNPSDGPTFHQSLLITPDGVLSTVTSSAAPGSFGVTLPVLTSDGETALENRYTPNIATVRFPGSTDEQNFISVDAAPSFTNTDASVSGPYGDIRPVRVVTSGASNTTFIYPRSADQPSAENVYKSFAVTEGGFNSILGRVWGGTYIGRTTAGGEGTGVDFDFDGYAELTFSDNCVFVMQRQPNGKVTRVETDRPVTMRAGGRTYELSAYTPLDVNIGESPVAPGEPVGDGNVAPVVAASGSEFAPVGSTVPITADVTDDDLPEGGTPAVTWSKVSGSGSVTFADASAAETTVAFDAAGTYVLRATASDGQLSATDDVTITAVDPSTIPVAVIDAVTHDAGKPVDVNVLANDNISAGAALSVVTQPAHGTAAVNDHGTTQDVADDTITYTPAADAYGDDVFTYRLAAAASSGAPGTTATVHVTLASGVSLVPDPADPTKTALLVVGNDEAEAFKFARKRDKVRVLRNKVQVGDPLDLPTGSVIVIAGGGNDVVASGSLKGNALVVYGGDGNDRISGSKFSDILIGGDGDDLITGSSGQDLLIGGAGADALTGAAGDDILVSGGTTYDNITPDNAAALRDLMTAWTAPAAYADRVAAITSIPGAGASHATLSESERVADADINLLNGSAGNDYFLADPEKDRAKKTTAEVNGLDAAAT